MKDVNAMNDLKPLPLSNQILNQALRVRAQRGFTLLELLVVIAIVGILASIAVGQYNSHIVQANRRAAIASLYAGQQIMERTRLQTGQYEVLNAGQINSLSDQGLKYTLTSALTNGGYRLTATPPVNAPDNDCGQLSITQSDARTVTGSVAVNQCWQ